MIERRCSEITSKELYTAIEKGKLKEVKRLIESENATIDLFAYEDAVNYQRLEILKYFLEKNLGASIYALNKAVEYGNEEFIKIIITFWKNNKQLCNFDLDSAILSVINEGISKVQGGVPQVTLAGIEGEMLNLIKVILDIYYK